MSSGSGDKPPSGTPAPTQPGRPAADTPQRLVVRSLDPGNESAMLGASDTAVAVANSRTSLSGEGPGGKLASMETPVAGPPSLSLAECLARESKLPEQRILRIASQTASALAAAHAKGIVHRDIKPENLFLLKRKGQDFVKVVDFGISKSLRQSDEQEATTRLTQTGMVLGTPLYMSPEQARGDDDLDHRVDIYALGVIMYETAAGPVAVAGTNYPSV